MFHKMANKLKSGIVLMAMLTLTACGGGGGGSSLVDGGGSTGGGGTPTTETYKIALATDKSNLSAGETANLTASVTDSSGAAVDGATVSFEFGSQLSGGTLSATSATTAAGTASVRYTAGNQTGADTIIATVTDPSGNTAQSAESIAVTAAQTTVGSVQILSSTGQVGTNSSSGTDITVIVKSPTNVLLPNVPVTLSASAGNITPPAGGFVTGANGAVTAKLDTQGLFKNEAITLNASASGVDAVEATVNVTGTTIAINGPNAGTAGNPLNYTLLLQDSNNKPIAGQSVNLASTVGIVTPGSVTTDLNGQALFSLAASADTKLTANAPYLNATGTLSVSVAQIALSFTQPVADFPDPSAILNINQPHSFNVLVTNGGSPAISQTLNFTTTRGTLSSTTATTNANGVASVNLSSTTAGPADVSASYSGVTASRSVAFTAPSATKVIVQAEPTTIAPNNSSTITAKLLDANNNVVVGKTVTFTTNDTSGGTLSNASAVTNAQGVATITFTAGNGTSADFQITANDQADGVNGSVTMNVASRSAFIVIGTDNTITKTKPNYQKTYSIIVTDINGKPIANQPVDIKLYSTGYGLGYWYQPAGTPPWISVVNHTCATNDTNHNGTLDADEKTVTNQQGQFVLAPGNVATFSPANPVTNADGIVNITVTYPETYANWVSVNLSATTTVLGTANTSVLNFVLPVSTDDVNSASGPAGNPSPFGNGVAVGTTENGVQGDGTSCSVIKINNKF